MYISKLAKWKYIVKTHRNTYNTYGKIEIVEENDKQKIQDL